MGQSDICLKNISDETKKGSGTVICALTNIAAEGVHASNKAVPDRSEACKGGAENPRGYKLLSLKTLAL